MGNNQVSSLEVLVDLTAILGAGVYFLFYAEELVYIGKARKLLARIYAHRNMLERKRAGVRGIKAVSFSKVKVYPCPEVDLDRLERELIERYQPKHNSNYIQPRPLAEPVRLNIGGIEIALGGVSMKPQVPAIERRF